MTVKNEFQVRVLRFQLLREIPGARSDSGFAALLEAMEFGDTAGLSGSDLRDMCIMSLQDLKPEEASALVLRCELSDRLKPGQIQNMANEMADEKLWEHYADMSLHERLFSVGSLLFAAFPQVFPEPDAVRLTLEVTAANDSARAALAKPLHESLLVRLLADGMDDRGALHRLFDKQLAGKSFPEADTIVWTVNTEATGKHALNVDVISSGYWLDALRNTKSYDSSAYAD